MANYYGKQGPKFILRSGAGGIKTITLNSPQEISENNWKLVQQQKRDVNDILRVGNLKYRYECTMSWYPTDSSGFTNISNLVQICNWVTDNTRSILYYPHIDKSLIRFPVIVTKGSPYLFSKVPYDAFTITVTSKNYLSGILDPNALAAVDMGGAISVEEGDSSGDPTKGLEIEI